MKRIVSILLCFVLIAGCMLSVNAEPNPMRFGDVDFDYDVTMLDATMIQRFLAGITEPSALQEALSDADNDEEMTVLDVTALQRYLVDIESAFVPRSAMEYYVGDTSSHSTAEIQNMFDTSAGEDICYIGVPVTFTGLVLYGAKPKTFRFYVDDVEVASVNAMNSRVHPFTYTFTEAGSYTVCTQVECRYNVVRNFVRRVRVIPLPDDDKPIIMGAAFFDSSFMNSGDGRLTVTALGGTAPYQYSYEVRYNEDESYDFDAPAESINGYDTGFIEDSELAVFESRLPPGSRIRDAIVRVKVRDATGAESDPVIVRYAGYELMM